MENCILWEITSASIWANITDWISRQILAVSGFARFTKNEGKSVINILQKKSLQKNPAGKIGKPARALGWRKLIIKKVGFFGKFHTG